MQLCSTWVNIWKLKIGKLHENREHTKSKNALIICSTLDKRDKQSLWGSTINAVFSSLSFSESPLSSSSSHLRATFSMFKDSQHFTNSSYSACFLSLDFLADSLFACFLLSRFNCLSSCGNQHQAVWCDRRPLLIFWMLYIPAQSKVTKYSTALKNLKNSNLFQQPQSYNSNQ